MVIRNKSNAERIEDEIRDAIREGNLTPGDRLASIKDLRAHFSAGQKTVQKALSELEEIGILDVRERSGCYVCEGAAERLAKASVCEPQIDYPAENMDPRDYFVPRCREGKTLTVYVSDVNRANASVWQEMFDHFHGADIELVSCGEGHAEDVFMNRPVDVVEATPAVINRIGADKFVSFHELVGTCETDTSDFVAPVRRRIVRSPALPGIPFSVTCLYLYVNQDIQKHMVTAKPPHNPWEFLDYVRQSTKMLDETPHNSMVLTNTLDWLFMTGALKWTETNGLRGHVDVARRLFRALKRTRAPAGSPTQESERFGGGELLYEIHCSFLAGIFMRNLDFAWKALPLPVVSDRKIPGWLNVLAITKDAARQKVGAELMRYLTSPSVREKIANGRGNLPVSKSDINETKGTPRNEVSRSTLDASLNRVTFDWPDNIYTQVHHRMMLYLGNFTDENGEINTDSLMEAFLRELEQCGGVAV